MKRILCICMFAMMVLGMGCSKEKKATYNPTPYTWQAAVENGDVVNLHGRNYNVDKLEKFVANVKNGKEDKIRITAYTDEGGAIITDLEFNGEVIIYTLDTTRDGFGSPTIVKKEFSPDSIYKGDKGYYLKSSPEDILIFVM